ncbi:hypothetical protein ATANTOWER_020437 [Ataeniobius toweri]|uniref:Uncharacterized protein n=1 Tax=Ataeniobius toweri TaxID=208326 RepID=A0ABU7BAG1_9TELE|nr:hypothetical protein [Ataeniobius toweri]
MFLYSNEGAEFYQWGGAGTAGRSSIRGCGRQKTACRREPGGSARMPGGARPAVEACPGGCRCFCGSCLCNKSSSSFQHVIHTHSAIYFPSQVNTATLSYGSNAVY